MNRSLVLIFCLVTAVLAACRQTDLGEGGSKVSGSAGPAGDQHAAKELLTCSEPIATISLAESPNAERPRTRWRHRSLGARLGAPPGAATTRLGRCGAIQEHDIILRIRCPWIRIQEIDPPHPILALASALVTW